MSSLPEPVHPQACALQAVRADVRNDRFIYYTPVTFPDDPFQGCELTLRQAAAVGYIKEGGSLELLVLDAEGTPVQEYPLTQAGFAFLRRRLRFVREPEREER